MLGDRPIREVVEHARRFVVALDGIDGRVLDLGAGGGVPGLVIAAERPDLEIDLLDRRRKRTDFLEQMVRRLGWEERVSVRCVDAVAYGRRHPFTYAAATARGFGPPAETLRTARRLVEPGGRVVISDPPDGDRWPPSLLDTLQVERVNSAIPAVAVFHVKHPEPNA